MDSMANFEKFLEHERQLMKFSKKEKQKKQEKQEERKCSNPLLEHERQLMKLSKQIEIEQEQEQEGQEEEQQEEPVKLIKPKRQISDLQRESLARAREMAQLKKKEMKELTEKKKIIQHLKKEENKIDIEHEYKETVERIGTKKQPQIIEPPKVEKPKPERKIKKIIYEDEEDEEPKQKEFSYVESTRKSAMQQMQDKINEDRMRFLYQKYILR